jgi:integrase
MTVKFYLKRPNDTRDSVIFARLNYNTICYKYYLLEKVDPTNWNSKTQRVKKCAKNIGATEFNHRLENISRKIIESFYKYQNTHYGQSPSPKSLRDILDDVFNKQSSAKINENAKKTFQGFFEDLLIRMESGSRLHTQKNTPLAPTTVGSMRNLLNHLRAFEKVNRRVIDFDTIDMRFYYGFVDYMTKVKKVSINTIGKLITNIKVVMREGVEFGYTTNMTFTHRRFRSLSTETDAVYLTETEIVELGKLDLSTCKRLESVRDLFLVGCNTGLRFSDLSQLSINSVSDNILTITQIKTGDCVYIPLKSEVRRIIEKYEGIFPAAISNQKFNQYLKEICSMCELLKKEVSIIKFVAGKKISICKPKYEFVMSHTARRSFATNEYLARDLQPAEIRALTGHKTDKSFYKYIRISPNDNALNVAKKWQEREECRLRQEKY